MSRPYELNSINTIYELYKKTLGLAGHIADVRAYKGYRVLRKIQRIGELSYELERKLGLYMIKLNSMIVGIGGWFSTILGRSKS